MPQKKPLLLRFLTFTALLTLFFQSITFAQTPENTDSPEELEGEVTVPPQFNSEEPIQITFRSGTLPSNLTQDELTEHSKNIEIIQNSTQSELPIIAFEEENKPLEVPAALTHGRKVLHIPIPKSVQKFWKSVYVKPSTGDITSGVLFASLRGITTSIIWYSNAHVSPVLATSMTVWMIAMTYTLSTYHITIDNALLYNIKDRESKIGKMWSKLVLGLRTLAFDLTLGNVTNLAGGMQRSVLQSTVDNLAITVVNNTYNAQRNVLLKDRRELKLTYNFITRPFMYVLRGFQDINKWPALFTIGAYPVTHSLVASIALYASMLTLNVVAGDTVISTLDKIHKKATSGIKKFGLWVERSTSSLCDKLLKGDNSTDKIDLGSNHSTFDHSRDLIVFAV